VHFLSFATTISKNDLFHLPGWLKKHLQKPAGAFLLMVMPG